MKRDTSTTGRATAGERWPRRWRHWTLRSRLAVVAASLTAAALLVANGAGLVLLRTYLVDRVDRQLATGKFEDLSQNRLEQLKSGALSGSAALSGQIAQRLSGDTRVYTVGSDGKASELLPDGTAQPGPDLPGRAQLLDRVDDAPFTVPGENDTSDWRMYVSRTTDGDELVVAASSLESVDATYERLLLIDVGVAIAVLALLGAAAAILVRMGLRPLTQMESTAIAIASGDFSRRVEAADQHTEPGRLGEAMNAMLVRVEDEITARRASEQQLRRVLADASHELRTPLTSIRGFAELARRGGDGTDALRRIEAEATRMGVLVEDLLLLARLDEQREVQQRPVDLLELCADVVRDLHARSPQRAVRLTALADDGALIEPVMVRGDALRLRQVIGNLLANADRHTSAEARIAVRLGTDVPDARRPVVAAVGDGPQSGLQAAVVEVTDSGAGVPAEHAPHVFERLYRADATRAAGGGSGLGLSIAAALVAGHGGRLELASCAPGCGATFRVLLPLPPAQRSEA
ncbi:sensor histidine kinase [Streptomyces sp. enrichment culture]|uniref:sensor histidine kinase n=1 Tax=Streptomyces sp. enrichment culture TaxID=1795815 RepID=UPI003F57DF61